MDGRISVTTDAVHWDIAYVLLDLVGADLTDAMIAANETSAGAGRQR